MTRRTRKLPASERWRRDPDYLDKLSPEDREWAEQFLDEYYGGKFTDEPLHKKKAKRREIYKTRHAAATDIVTASDNALEKSTKPITLRPSLVVRFYSADDYAMLAPRPPLNELDETLTDALDRGHVQEDEKPAQILPLRRQA